MCEKDGGVMGCNSAIIYYAGSIWLTIDQAVNLHFNVFSGDIYDVDYILLYHVCICLGRR